METIRRRARDHMMKGPLTPAYGSREHDGPHSTEADRQRIVAVLQETLATELVCELRYRAHYYAAAGFRGEVAADEFLEHAREEREHGERIAARIAQLGGQPNFDPASLSDRAHADYGVGEDLVLMLEEDLVAERVAVQTYTEIIRWLGDADPTTRRMMEEILAQEEEHADDIAGLLERARAHQKVEVQA